jgi:hypothetical protein
MMKNAATSDIDAPANVDSVKSLQRRRLFYLCMRQGTGRALSVKGASMAVNINYPENMISG